MRKACVTIQSLRNASRIDYAPCWGMAPLASWSSKSACSHVMISSSQDFTSDWRADESDCMIPSVKRRVCQRKRSA